MQGDERLQRLADRSANFGFLLPLESLLLSYGAAAESSVYDDPNTALVKARQFGEAAADALITRLGLRYSGDRQVDKLRALNQAGALTPKVHDVFDELRRVGNRAVHEHYADGRTALTMLRHCFGLGVWLHRAVTGDRTPMAFVAPAPGNTRTSDAVRADLERYRDELVATRTSLQGEIDRARAEEAARIEAETQLATAAAAQDELASLVEQLTGDMGRLRAELDARVAAPPQIGTRERDALVDRARRASRVPLTEAQTRETIDEMLVAAGWLVQDVARLNLDAGRGVAVREVTMGSGRADYLLYVDAAIVGVIEAKREGTPLSATSMQSSRYADQLTAKQRMRAWRTPLPLRYESSGVETWFTNALDPNPRARAVFSFHRPETVANWMVESDADPDAPTYRARLRVRMPELCTDGLRPAQVDAVRGIEGALAADKPRALVQMATGAGKTFTAVTTTYRLLKHADARRVLFLVDRNNLGRQALAEFTNYVTPDDGRKLSELYVVQRLTGDTVLDSSNVVIATVQRLYSMLSGRELPADDAPDEDDPDLPVEVAYNPAIPPETFDLIVIDECHRSIYGKWRDVLRYFDAHLVGLTATPVALTFGFFSELVSEYTYQQAVADGVNVDFDVYRIRTELGERGGTIPAETVVPVRDRHTRRERYQSLDDDLTYAGSQLGRSVISKGQLRLVLATFRANLFTDIFPGRTTVPKTLIFAKDDNHAEEIVHLVREIFDKGNDFCAKITYRAEDPEGMLARFRNSTELRVAVTVDMIATGTDVRPLECVFFLRDVQSWAYFEQMKGRGARTVPEAEFRAVTPDARRKDRFVIIDAVGVTDSPRVDAAPLQRSGAQQISLEKLLGKAANRTLTVEEASTLASRLARLDQQIEPDERAELESVAGRPLRAIVRGIVDAIDVDAQTAAGDAGGPAAQRALVEAAVAPLAANPDLRTRILEIRRAHDIVYDEINIDQILDATKKTFDDDNPKHVVSSWREWIAKHRDEIDALRAAFAGPEGPASAYDQLAALAGRIARPPLRWTPARLWAAYVALGEARDGGGHGVAELMSILRYELGMDTSLQPYSSRVEENLAAWVARQEQEGAEFTVDQHWWLSRIADVVVASLGCPVEVLDETPFVQRGGVDGFLDAFGPARAEGVLAELNAELPA